MSSRVHVLAIMVKIGKGRRRVLLLAGTKGRTDSRRRRKREKTHAHTHTRSKATAGEIDDA